MGFSLSETSPFSCFENQKIDETKHYAPSSTPLRIQHRQPFQKYLKVGGFDPSPERCPGQPWNKRLAKLFKPAIPFAVAWADFFPRTYAISTLPYISIDFSTSFQP